MTPDEFVDKIMSCPRCDEDRKDKLVWINMSEVQCMECEKIYIPGSAEAESYRRAYKEGYDKGFEDAVEFLLHDPAGAAVCAEYASDSALSSDSVSAQIKKRSTVITKIQQLIMAKWPFGGKL